MAITAALEAARAAAAARTGQRPPSPPRPATPAAEAAVPPAATPAMRPSAAPAGPASAPSSAPGAGYAAPAPAPAAPAVARGPAPWEDAPPPAMPNAQADDGQGGAAVLEAPPAARVAPPQQQADDDLPPWVTGFSDESAVPAGADHIAGMAQAAPAQRAAPAKAPYEYVITPVPELGWDGNWPALAAHLPLRGVAQQLATQAELVSCTFDGNMAVFRIRCPIETWATAANVEKLTSALAERFGRPARVETEIGKAWYTTSVEAQIHRDNCQRAAEEAVAADPFIKAMVRDFGAFVVPGSIVAPMTPAH